MVPKVFSLAAEDIGLGSVEMPSPNFDATKATRAEALRFGLLPPPDSTQPTSYQQFLNATAPRDATRVTPRFAPRSTPTRISRSRPPADARSDNDRWAGVVIERKGLPLMAVYKTWTMPKISMPATMQGDGTCIDSVWVGLDGWGASQNDVLQIGLDLQTIRTGGHVETGYYAWVEWWQNDSYYFDFPVAAGDKISCAVYCEPDACIGTVYMTNLTTKRVLTPIKVTAQAGTKMLGNCAEWIVERQSFSKDTADLAGLCDFGRVTFEQAFASETFPQGRRAYPQSRRCHFGNYGRHR